MEEVIIKVIEEFKKLGITTFVAKCSFYFGYIQDKIVSKDEQTKFLHSLLKNGINVIFLTSLNMRTVEEYIYPEWKEYGDRVKIHSTNVRFIAKENGEFYTGYTEMSIPQKTLNNLRLNKYKVLSINLLPEAFFNLNISNYSLSIKDIENFLTTKIEEITKTVIEKHNIDTLVKSPINDEQECPICFEDPENKKITSCGHVFCNDCIKLWLPESCPICREINPTIHGNNYMEELKNVVETDIPQKNLSKLVFDKIIRDEVSMTLNGALQSAFNTKKRKIVSEDDQSNKKPKGSEKKKNVEEKQV